VDFRPYDRAALELSAHVVDQVTAEQLDLVTPCAPWTVRDVLSHVVSQHLRFAAAARGQDPELACPLDKADLGPDPAAAYRAAADTVTEAFAAGADDKELLLPEIGRPIPLRLAISFHFFDFLVHGWDVAASIDAPYAPSAELLAQAFPVAAGIPDSSRAPGGSFAPVVRVDEDADGLGRLLAVAGRDPRWAPRQF
jgi:uncharacterized protein (TIGR03086 family)